VIKPAPLFGLVPHVGPEVELIRLLPENTGAAPVVQLAGTGTMAQLDQAGVGAKVFGVIALLLVPYRLATRAAPVQVAKLAELHSVSPYGI
jgi:hypothetical protein